MKILITGGLGYVGGRLSEHLRASVPGADIRLTTRDNTRKLPEWSKSFQVETMDVRDPASIASCLNGKGVDVIIHLAALNDAQCAADPDQAFEVNTRGTFRLLEGAMSAGTRRFIYFSTIHVYGPVLSGALTEESPTSPVHLYGITHRAAEDMVNYFRHYRGMKTLIFRMSNGYGYPMNKEVDAWTLVFNDLCRQLMTTGRMALKSSGKQRRDFIALSDAAAAVEYFLSPSGADHWGRTYNLGSGRSVSILEAAASIQRVYREKYGKEPGPLTVVADSPGSPAPASVDYGTSRLRNAGFLPKNEMDLEIRKTLELCAQFVESENHA